MRCFGYLPLILPIAAAVFAQGNLAPETELATDWCPLFDGRSAGHWRGVRGTPFPADYWRIEDGCLATVPAVLGRDLITVDEYENFDFRFEWKIEEGGNSGVKYLVDESVPSPYLSDMLGGLAAWLGVCVIVLMALRRRQRALAWTLAGLALVSVIGAGKIREYLTYSATGLELQLIDDAGQPNGRNPLRRTGALYGLIAPAVSTRAGAGVWNSGRVVVRGDDVEHWINGVRLVRYRLGSPELAERIAASPYAGLPGFGGRLGKRIVLQHHQDRVWFRNLRIRRLGNE